MRMHGMPEALAILARAKEERLPTVVYGDYDVDGVCACALLTQALRRYGVDAQPHTPLRAEGYGLNAQAVTRLAKDYRVLVTVDLGITNHEEVRLAQSLGMRVIVTDHHGLGLSESPADAVMNPLLGDYPFRKLCGTALPSSWRRRCWARKTAWSTWIWPRLPPCGHRAPWWSKTACWYPGPQGD